MRDSRELRRLFQDSWPLTLDFQDSKTLVVNDSKDSTRESFKRLLDIQESRLSLRSLSLETAKTLDFQDSRL